MTMKTLGEIAEVQVGFAFKSAEFSENPTHTRLLRGDNIAQGSLRWQNAARWPEVDVDPRYELRKGDVVLAMDRPWIDAGLKFATVEERDLPSYLVQRVARLRARPNTHQRYLHYVIAGAEFARYVQAEQTGTAVPHISGAQISSFPVVKRSLAEQRAIAEVLGALDDKIAANERCIDVARQLMILTAGSARGKASVADLAETRKRSTKPDALTSEVSLFSLPAFDDGESPEVCRSDSIKSNKIVLDSPCVLLSKLNPRFSRVWDVSSLPAQMAVASTEFVVLVPRDISTAQLWASLSQPAVQSELRGMVAGTSGSHQRVKPAEIMQLNVPDPRNLESSAGAQITSLGKLRHAQRIENRRLESTRDELLPLLMSGKVRVKDAEKVVEEVT